MLPSRWAHLHKGVKTSRYSKEELLQVHQQAFNLINQHNYHLTKRPVWLAHYNEDNLDVIIPYHSMLVAGVRHSQRNQPTVYSFVINVMRNEFILSATFLDLIKKLKFLDNERQLEQDVRVFIRDIERFGLAGKSYPSPEYFFRDWNDHAEVYNDKEMEMLLANRPPSWRLLIDNHKVIHKYLGTYSPMIGPTHSIEQDTVFFTFGEPLMTRYDIHELTLSTIQQEQRLYMHYLDAKLGIGTATTSDEKDRALMNPKHAQVIENIVARRIHHRDRPSNERESNCNATVASFLQTAINREQNTNHKTYRELNAVTFFAFGTKHRVHFHDPLAINDKINALTVYQQQRTAEDNHGKLNGLTRQVKLSACNKAIMFLKNKPGEQAQPLTKKEEHALNQGRLGKIFNSK